MLTYYQTVAAVAEKYLNNGEPFSDAIDYAFASVDPTPFGVYVQTAETREERDAVIAILHGQA